MQCLHISPWKTVSYLLSLLHPIELITLDQVITSISSSSRPHPSSASTPFILQLQTTGATSKTPSNSRCWYLWLFSSVKSNKLLFTVALALPLTCTLHTVWCFCVVLLLTCLFCNVYFMLEPLDQMVFVNENLFSNTQSLKKGLISTERLKVNKLLKYNLSIIAWLSTFIYN